MTRKNFILTYFLFQKTYEKRIYEIVLKKRSRKNKSVRDYTLKHEVVKGDTLYSISKKYKISIKELLKINKLKDRTLTIGQLLIIDK